ncbi:hypothetical protein J2046_002175 [Rhizobium petrolearium]|nr:hypothetical protein [Neorhizobium petrolearium]
MRSCRCAGKGSACFRNGQGEGRATWGGVGRELTGVGKIDCWRFGGRFLAVHVGASHGLMTAASVSSKSLTLRVTRIRSWTIAVAAISPSISPRGRVAARRPHSTAI